MTVHAYVTFRQTENLDHFMCGGLFARLVRVVHFTCSGTSVELASSRRPVEASLVRIKDVPTGVIFAYQRWIWTPTISAVCCITPSGVGISRQGANGPVSCDNPISYKKEPEQKLLRVPTSGSPQVDSKMVQRGFRATPPSLTTVALESSRQARHMT
jgi:hypothetical protein